MTDRMRPDTAGLAAELRRHFDEAFAAAPVPEPAQADLLLVRLAGSTLAIRVTEVSGLFTGVPIVRVPSPAAGLLGLAGLRGAVIPVYDLRALLGQATEEQPRWMVLAAATPLALAFDAFDRQVRVAADAVAVGDAAAAGDALAADRVTLGRATYPIVSVTSIARAIASRLGAGASRG